MTPEKWIGLISNKKMELSLNHRNSPQSDLLLSQTIEAANKIYEGGTIN